MFTYFWERERQSVSGGGAKEREGDTESGESYKLWSLYEALQGARTHEPWDHNLNWRWMISRLSHQAPHYFWIFDKTKLVSQTNDISINLFDMLNFFSF